jgi:hypothetical protein
VIGNHWANDFPLGIGQVGRVRFSGFSRIFHCISSVKGRSERFFRTQENNIFHQNAQYQYLR